MIYVGIDVSKDKHDCAILNSEAITLKSFSVPNNLNGFNLLLDCISSFEPELSNVKVGLEATGHYSINILGYLLDKDITSVMFNPLHTNLYRKSLTLRKTKTDKLDAVVIAKMLIAEPDCKPYSKALYHNEQLKSLSRYRFSKIRERAVLRQQITRLVNILFPELESLVSSLHSASVYALLEAFPSAKEIASANITKLSNILSGASKGRFGKDKAMQLREAARNSVGSVSSAQSLELKHTVALVNIFSQEIEEIDSEIEVLMEELNSPITSIPGMGTETAAMILSEIGDFNNFDSPDKILAFAGASPSIYQSGKMSNAYPHMEKRGSRYLRYALFNAAFTVTQWEPTFAAYLQKKLDEGKHYYVAISHVIKKLVRVIYHLQTTGETYSPAAPEAPLKTAV